MMKTKKLFQVVLFVLLAFIAFNATTNNTIGAKSKETESNVLISKTITLTNHKRHKFNVGFVKIVFKKDCLPEDMYPITFEVEVYAEDGRLYVEFSPDVDEFLKDVKITIRPYEGFIYDRGTDEFIYVDIEKTVFYVPHFSRWCFAW